MKLTRREINLLYIMFTLGIIVAFLVLIILPYQSSISAQKDLNATLTSEKTLIDAQITNGANLDSKLTTALGNVNVELDRIEAPITSEEFELKLQPYLVTNDIQILSWVVNEPVVSPPSLPYYQKSSLVYKLQELLDSYNQIQTATGSIPLTDTELVKTTLILSFTSPYAVYTGLLDLVASWKSTAYVSATNRENVSGTSTIFIDFYSISKPTSTQP